MYSWYYFLLLYFCLVPSKVYLCVSSFYMFCMNMSVCTCTCTYGQNVPVNVESSNGSQLCEKPLGKDPTTI